MSLDDVPPAADVDPVLMTQVQGRPVSMTEGVEAPVETMLLEACPGSGYPPHFCDALALVPDQHLGHAFVASAWTHRDRPAFTTASGGTRYVDLLSRAFDVCRHLRNSATFCPGARVLLLLPNSAEYAAALYGTLLAGGVAVPLPPKMERQQFLSIRRSTAAAHLITQSRIVRSCPDLQEGGRVTSVGATQPAAMEIPEPSADGLAVILFTGGSTGRPKGVMLSHRNLLENARSIQQYLGIQVDDRPLCVLPFNHAFGNSVLQSHLLAGSELILDGNAIFPETVLAAIRKHGATSLSGVPDLFRYLLERSSLGVSPLPSLSYLSVAGGSLPRELSLQLISRIAPARLIVMYGQTEATARLAYVPPERLGELGNGCIGRPVPGVDLEVVDETGARVPAGAVGEIRARGPNIMLGYWSDPALTSKTVREGWLYTGDLGTVDQAGWIYHRGRRNALIKIAGYRIHPSDVEEFVMRVLPIEQAVLVPFEMPERGTRLALYVRLKPEGRDLNPAGILSRCHADLPRHMVPDLIQFVEVFPVNDALKVDRMQLSSLAVEAVMHRMTALSP